MAHTPGPWNVVLPPTGEDVSIVGRTPAHRNPIFIGRVYGPGILSKDVTNRNANARLIAAAPELLQALRLLREHCEYEHLRVVADAVLAKVDGKAGA